MNGYMFRPTMWPSSGIKIQRLDTLKL